MTRDTRSVPASICSCTGGRPIAAASAFAGVGTPPASIFFASDLEITYVSSLMLYSTCPLLSRTESATIRLPFFNVMVSAQLAQAAKQQIVMIRRNQKNCSKSGFRITQVFHPMVTRMLLAVVLGTRLLSAQTTSPAGEAMSMYRQILNPAFSPEDVHRVRNVSIDRDDLHIVLTDGVIGLIRPVNAHVTRAVFEGAGHILLLPPDRAERTSLALFTNSGVLDDSFGVAYFRFFDHKLVH